ncbi:MAG TPA: hypothetical protein VN428_27330, partial [Bryobacteraceae bacterium]|nr:hypothetical protein [Bryobacteraceae bacterium]
GPLYAYRKLRDAAEVRELGPGRFEVRHSLDPKVYATSITLAFERASGGTPDVFANGRRLAQRPPMPADGWDAEYFRAEGANVYVTVRPNAVIEIR